MVHGQPRNPRYQHLVKKGNDILQMRIGSWMEGMRRTDWSVGLKSVVWTMNNQYCSAHKTTPYKIVFGQYPYVDTNLVDILDDDLQNEETNSLLDDFPESDSEMTFVTANNDSGNEDNNDKNWLNFSTSQVYSISPQENIEVSDSESVDTIRSN
ncbi:hypothetical protein C2G38_2160228 [Gigaspora rosea]|uniref:Uncharacterized protein n=1 Tax=Gigaspora rosea TaxID=44941 RepID=A0A397W1W7_9GLOM|nr:hypothetical protein C2G38_2160228 [Gigaspora rosea]